ncbi:glycosyltransferase [Microbulbifer sp. JSM ZJ756]|uniref:glycosyltransferase n=1 Tax=Microbulbifer sp. JSM ZJ756 TaxID=3376191 RepID=UPI0037AC1724
MSKKFQGLSLRELAYQSLQSELPEKAVALYFLDSLRGCNPADCSEFWLSLARKRWLRSRRGQRKKVGVCCWSLSHNPAGRAMALAEAYAPHADVEILGCMMPGYGDELWPPIRSSSFSCSYIIVESDAEFARQALELVIQHPYDVVHLSKPRIHNVIFGWLYQLVWGARVIMDVDDEELAFVEADAPLNPREFIRNHGALPELKDLRQKLWTQLAVGMVDQFDAITVSNGALQKRYGGQIIPHVRPESRFRPSLLRSKASRREFGISEDTKVVLFFGTPRKHKGVAETARVLASLQRSDICYVVAGGEPDVELKRELANISGLEIILIGEQPYERAPDIIALGDVCILLQDETAQVSQFQLPAKLIDALAMGLTVFAQKTPPLEGLVNQGAIIPVTRENIATKLQAHFNDPDPCQYLRARGAFVSGLTVEAVTPVVDGILKDDSPRRAEHLSWQGQLEQILKKRKLPLGVPVPR